MHYRGLWKDGLKEGLHEVYSRDGQLAFKSNWKDGKKIPQ